MQPDDTADAEPQRTRGLGFAAVGVVLATMLVVIGGLGYFIVNGFPGGPDAARRFDAQAATTSRDRVPVAKVNRFDGPRAYRLTARQVGYGQRPAGSPALVRLAPVLRSLLPLAVFEPLPDSTAAKPLRNIIGTIPGRRPAIVIGAHYDTLVKPVGFVGANNGAAGSAVVVGIAEAMKRVRRAPGAPELKFVLFDGEEPDSGLPEEQADFYNTGLRGSRAYVAAHPGATRTMLLLDYVGGRNLTLPREASSDKALWKRVRAAATKVGVGSVFPDRSDILIQDDHTPFLRAGVPAVDFIDWSYPGHSLQDGMKLISTKALDAVGETVVEYLRTAR
ncbi:hypothetical protein DSM112329_03527 [Paraconexibacter sp. AEG42_29]|uniref:Peptidase M28 domain-containing protein n=1 Tax=Paraconexibacter sp. AEG42_29 TaxID=2997339 RepID=A0AAU7AYB5_9ACTN